MRLKAKLIMAGLAAVGLYALAGGGRRREQTIGRDGEAPPAEREPSRTGWDEVDEASYESFPASDPPSYNRGNI